MVMSEETPAERDRRVRGEEARMVRMEERLDAVHELLVDLRRERARDRDELNKHLELDDKRFSSIDSRLQGFQTQITTMTDSLNRIEKGLTGTEGLTNRVQVLEDGERDRSAVQRFLASTWTHVIAGAGLSCALIGVAISFGWI